MLREDIIPDSLFRQWEKKHHDGITRDLIREHLDQKNWAALLQMGTVFFLLIIFPAMCFLVVVAWAEEPEGFILKWSMTSATVTTLFFGILCLRYGGRHSRKAGECLERFASFYDALNNTADAFAMPYSELHLLIPNGRSLLVEDAGKILRLQKKEERFKVKLSSKERVDLENSFRGKFDALKAFGVVSGGYGPIFADAQK